MQFGLADLAPLRSIQFCGRGQIVDPVIAPLLPFVETDLQVEAFHLDALGIDLVNKRGTGRIGDYDVTFVFKPELPKFIEACYFLGLAHNWALSAPDSNT